MAPKRTVTYNGTTYKVRKDRIEIPDLEAMPRIEALQWLNLETYPTGHGIRTKPNPLAGLGDAINLEVR
jgi:hypothetical protein